VCLVVIAWRVHPRHPLIVATNRDELHARPAAPLARWNAPPGLIAGRDLEAGGTWLGLDPRGRLGLVTNHRERSERRRDAPSRGELVPRFLGGSRPAGDYLAELEREAASYAGFNLLLLDASGLWYAHNRQSPFARPLAPGLYGLANQELDTPSPELLRTRARVAECIERSGTAAAAATATVGAIDELFDILSAPEAFVRHPQYGTRCSTVILGERDGPLIVSERTFAADGSPRGETRLALDTAPL
jgi:uncharacterized protein with NRDE domain